MCEPTWLEGGGEACCRKLCTEAGEGEWLAGSDAAFGEVDEAAFGALAGVLLPGGGGGVATL